MNVSSRIAVHLFAFFWIIGPVVVRGQTVESPELAEGFRKLVKPFLDQHCVRCHQAEKATSGIRVDQLDVDVKDSHIKLWQHIRGQILNKSMPPEDEAQPEETELASVSAWIDQALHFARSRPVPKNGLIRRLTIDQYRNTLRELLLLEDDLTDSLPPDAVSSDGFVNNNQTLQLSPLQLEAYIEIAGEAISRSIVNPRAKPKIQNFRVDMGRVINSQPCPDKLILGAGSLLLDNADFVVQQLTPEKPFAFEPFFMRTKYRFHEGYEGNDTVRGWREYDSIYHAVFACMRGTNGYPKGNAFDVVPQGLLLRPAIPSAELFQIESTYGPRANFKISLRELPNHGRFRVTVVAAKYNDGLLLDGNDKPRSANKTAVRNEATESPIVCFEPENSQSIRVRQPGIYQIDVYKSAQSVEQVVPDASRLADQLAASWNFDAPTAPGHMVGDAKLMESPFGQAAEFDGKDDYLSIPREATLNIGEGDFTVAAWIRPRALKPGGIISLGKGGWTHGWYLDLPNNRGVFRLETSGPNDQPNGSVAAPAGSLTANTWQHIAAVVRRGEDACQLYVNGWPVAKGTIGWANLDNPRVDLQIGRVQDGPEFRGSIDEVKLYRRALDENEIQALLEKGRQFVPKRPREKPHALTLKLGDREFTGILHNSPFVVVRLPAGDVAVQAEYAGAARLDQLVLTRLDETGDELAQRFNDFEKRAPRIGVHLGFRRDCGSTLARVGKIQTVSGESFEKFIFEGAINNFPSPDVQDDNDNYLAGVREIGVRSEYTDGREMPRLLLRSVEFEGPLYDSWPPASHQAIFGNSTKVSAPDEQARQVIRRFATRAFRRPITDSEEQQFLAIYRECTREGNSFEQSLQTVLQVILTSPQFLFLIEQSQSPAPEMLDDYELAAKLAYFLWNGPPDAQLLSLAAEKKLLSRLDSELLRMINDHRFENFINQFVPQWLALDKFQVLEPDRGRFPKLTRDTRVELMREPSQLVQYLIRNNSPARHLIESDLILANEVVAAYYDLASRTESGFDFVPIKHHRRDLGGIMSQAAILAGLSDGRESNPVKRGAWIARRIIADPPDDPPPNVPALESDVASLTLRERLERHRNQPGCAQCHSKIDPWGIPLEEFDAGGRMKSQATDAQSTLPDGENVAGVNDLKRYLTQDRMDQVAFSVLKHLAIYACGRNLAYNELADLKANGVHLKNTDYRLQDMLKLIVHSDIFLHK